MAKRSLPLTLTFIILSFYIISSTYSQDGPVISDVNISNLTSKSVTITWQTNKPTRCRIKYGETTSYGKTTGYSKGLTAYHKVNIHHLKGDTSYHYRIIAEDSYGTIALSEDFTFTTKEPYALKDNIGIKNTVAYPLILPPIILAQPPTEETGTSAALTLKNTTTDKTVPILGWTGEDGFSDDGVTPDTGYGSTNFEFRIKYFNNGNKAPLVHRVYIDKNGDGDFEDQGEANDMLPQGDDYINGVVYFYSTNIPYFETSNGSKYYFEFSDGSSLTQGEIPAGYSPQTAIDGPVILQTLSISISPNTWNIGEVGAGTTATMRKVDKVTVANKGDGREDFTLSLVNPDGWVAGPQPGAERFVLNAAFSQYPENIIWDEKNHLVTTESVISTETRFAGDENGKNVPPDESRSLFLQFKSPTQTKLTDPESIRLIISCEVPKN